MQSVGGTRIVDLLISERYYHNFKQCGWILNESEDLKMHSPTMKRIERVTKEFLALHWNGNALDDKVVQWDRRWKVWRFTPGEIPDHFRSGCYALCKDEDVLYIGSGVSTSAGKYPEHGLARRLQKHWRVKEGFRKSPVKDRQYEPSGPWKDKGINSIWTFGFPEGFGYLSLALEAYLISKINPECNSRGRKEGGS